MSQFVGSNPDRQAKGRQGHCEACMAWGHLKAHPAMTCEEVGCTEAHFGGDNPAPKVSNSEEQEVVPMASTKDQTKPVKRNPSMEVLTREEHTIAHIEGRDYYERNCYKMDKHPSHTWKSYFFAGTVKEDNAFCDGSGDRPLYASTFPKKKMKDYSEDAENFPVSDPITVAQARKIAYDMHKDQKDKNGEPYRLHLNAVEKGVVLFGGTDEERIAALFHDAVEDDHTTYALLRKINLTEHTIGTIEAVSKRSMEEQSKYLARILEFGESACRVKLADLIHNTRHDRLAVLSEHTRTRLLKKYRPAMATIMLHLGILATEDTQEKLATKPQGSSYGYTSPYGSKTTSTSTSGGGKGKNGYWSGGVFHPTTPTKHNDKPEKRQSGTGNRASTASERAKDWSVRTIFPGDWVIGWDAPVIGAEEEKNEVMLFLLGNGEVREEKMRNPDGSTRTLKAYSRHDWTMDDTVKFDGIDEETVFDYMEMVQRKAVKF